MRVKPPVLGNILGTTDDKYPFCRRRAHPEVTHAEAAAER
jgi:hypothetical protein